MAYCILFIEDDPMIAASITRALGLAGQKVTHFTTVKAAQEALEEKAWDALLLDVNLPDGTGFEVCKIAQTYYPLMPILMLTANTDEDSVVKSLELGAVDYMRKPVGAKEILARVKKALGDKEMLQYGDLRLNLKRRELHVKGELIPLPRREFDILCVLAKKPEEVVSRAEILERTKSGEETMERSIDSHLSRLRKRLSSANLTIDSVYGTGYKLKKAA